LLIIGIAPPFFAVEEEVKAAKKLSRIITKRRLSGVYTRVFCIRFSLRDGAAAQLLPLLFSHT
jgi:hypothetical protein